MNEEAKKITWFETNPKKTIIILVVAVWIILDTTAAMLLPRREIGTPSRYYHHDLKKSFKLDRNVQGRKYTIYTNSLGFIDKSNRTVALKSDKYRILFMGDSFTEGSGYPYEQTFIGLIESRTDPSKVELLDAGVRSYSPKLYYLKTEYLLEKLGLKFDYLVVLVDVSDIQDEIAYENYVPGDTSYYLAKADVFMKERFLSYRNIAENLLGEALAKMRQRLFGSDDMIHTWASRRDLWADTLDYVKERDAWLNDENVYEKWGKRGIELAEKNMDLLYKLCKRHKIPMTIVVYPWPSQVARGELISKQVSIWKNFAEKRQIDFVNCFSYFIDQAKGADNVRKYFLPGDVHWNDQGHILMADILWKKLRDKIK
jgi:hypothetical protein